jgi:mRNA-degrading endonuclease RelE of RelBE toxin-antitoxin system
MSFSVKFIPKFEKELKQLAKKYPSLKSDFSTFLLSIKENPIQGTALGNNCYKIRFAIRSKGNGKAGGARIITCVKVVN